MRWYVLHALFALIAAPTLAQPIPVVSPDGHLRVSITVADRVTWQVLAHDKPVLVPSPIGMTLTDGTTLGRNAEVVAVTMNSVDQILRPVVPTKRIEIRDRYNECRIDFKGSYSLIVRAFDDGVAYRWATRFRDQITVHDELATFHFPADHLVYLPSETDFVSHQERLYERIQLSAIADSVFSGIPVLLRPENGPTVVITEADLLDYPGMDIQRDLGTSGLRGFFPWYPTVVKMDEKYSDRTERVLDRAPWIAKTKGTREFPWRILVVAENDRTLLDTDIVYRLASESKIRDTSWIRPGLVQWDWWNANNLFDVPFRAGVNTATYLYHIDFAADHGIPYVILDEGWYELGALLHVMPDIDMEKILTHARERDVGIILWTTWKTFDEEMDAALDQFERWGIAGLKIDFMQREDQWMVNFYERAARACADHHLLVDFHGSCKPSGLSRTYPNVMTQEGVKGLEHSKWSDVVTPDHNVTFPFIRMLAGPVDYTPGAMLNAAKDDFVPVFNRPMSQGTRCQQLAMYVVYESPLQMLADSPSNYLREPECLKFLASIPTVWDETVILDARLGEYIVTARKSGATWYIGALTNWQARDLVINLRVLGPSPFDAEIFRDGPNADRVGMDYAHELMGISDPSFQVHLAPGGGWLAHLTPRH